MADGKIKVDTDKGEKSSKLSFDKIKQMATDCAKSVQGIFGSIKSGVSSAISSVSSVMSSVAGTLGALGKSVMGYLGANADVLGLMDKIKGVINDAMAPAAEVLNAGIAKCVGTASQLVDSFVNAGVAQEAWKGAGQVFSDTMTKALGQIDGLIQSVGSSFLKVWQSETGQKTCNLILGILTSISKIVDELVGGFKKAWDSAGIGESIVKKVWDAFNNLLSIAKKVFDFIGKLVSMIDWKPILEGVEVVAGVLEDITAIFDDGVEEILGCFLEGDFSGAGEALSDMFEDAIDYVTEFIKSIDWVQLGKDIAQKIGGGIGAIVDFILGIDWIGLLISVGGLIIEGLCAGLALLGAIVVDLFVQMFDAICEFFGIEDASKKFLEFGSKILLGIQNGLAGLGEWFTELFTSAWNSICEVFAGIGDFFTKCWEDITVAFGNCCEWFSQLFTDAWDSICAVFAGIGEFFTKCWEDVTVAFGNCCEWFSQLFTDAWNGIKGVFEGVGKFFGEVWNGITSVFGNVVGWFKDRFSEAWTAVKNVFSAGGKIFEGIKDGILSALKSVINAIISGINTVIKIPFDGINAALKAIKKVDIFGFKPFSWIGTISVPQIPKLARGGIVNRPTLAMIGEAGKEAVMPLQNNTQWMNDLADIINARSTSSSEDKVINLYVDGNKLFTWFLKEQKKQQIVLNGGLL